MTGGPALAFEGVRFAYGETLALEDVTLAVAPGELVAVIGPNGGGKTTLVRLALGLLEPAAGRVRLFGLPPASAVRRVGYVPQTATFPRDFPITARETVRIGRLGRRAWWRPLDAADRAAADRALEEVGAGPLADRPIASLSGGQLQRVLIARALATEPELLLLDEPTAHVDTSVRHDFFRTLMESRRSLAIVLVSHDVGFVSRYAQRVACLDGRLIACAAPPLEAHVLARLYGGHAQPVTEPAANESSTVRGGSPARPPRVRENRERPRVSLWKP
jgi:zinc transport system ATP-binding protein